MKINKELMVRFMKKSNHLLKTLDDVIKSHKKLISDFEDNISIGGDFYVNAIKLSDYQGLVDNLKQLKLMKEKVSEVSKEITKMVEDGIGFSDLLQKLTFKLMDLEKERDKIYLMKPKSDPDWVFQMWKIQMYCSTYKESIKDLERLNK